MFMCDAALALMRNSQKATTCGATVHRLDRVQNEVRGIPTRFEIRCYMVESKHLVFEDIYVSSVMSMGEFWGVDMHGWCYTQGDGVMYLWWSAIVRMQAMLSMA